MEIKLLVSDIHIHLHVKPDHEVLARLDAVIHRLGLMENRIMKELDDLKVQVAATRTVAQSAITLINGIADRITAAGVDPQALADLTASLKSDDDALAAAVSANTPAATT
jgi:hypothetical protein